MELVKATVGPFKNSVNRECASDSQSSARVEMTKGFVVWRAARQTAASAWVKPSLRDGGEHPQLTDGQFLLLSAVFSALDQIPAAATRQSHMWAHQMRSLGAVPDNTLLSRSICSIPWCFFFRTVFRTTAHARGTRSGFSDQLGDLAPGDVHSTLYCAAECKCQRIYLLLVTTGTHLHTHTHSYQPQS